MEEEQTNIVAGADEANRNSIETRFNSVLLMNSRPTLVFSCSQACVSVSVACPTMKEDLALLFEPFVFATACFCCLVCQLDCCHGSAPAVEGFLYSSTFKTAEFMSRAWLINLWYRRSCLTSAVWIIVFLLLSGIQIVFLNLSLNVWRKCQTTKYCRAELAA